MMCNVAIHMSYLTHSTVNYKPKLEALLADIVLLTEVAELGLEVEASGLEDLIDHEEDEMQLEASVRPSLAMKSKWVDVDDMLHIPTAGETKIDMGVEGDAKDDLDEEEDDFDITSSMGNRSSSRMFTINDLLDQWEEPVNKLDKVSSSRAYWSYCRTLNSTIAAIVPVRGRVNCRRIDISKGPHLHGRYIPVLLLIWACQHKARIGQVGATYISPTCEWKENLLV